MPNKKNKTKEEAQVLDDNELTTEAAQAAELDILKAQLAEAQSKTQEYLDALQRERADFTNYRRRTDLDIAQMGRLASGTTIKKFLAAIDDLERALAHRVVG